MLQGLWKEQQAGHIIWVWLWGWASSSMAEKGQVLSVNKGVQRGECKEAVKKCDATRPGPDPELSRANGKTRNESWILLQRDCNCALQRAQDPPSLASQQALVPVPGRGEPCRKVVCYCYCHCCFYYWKSIFTAVKVSYEWWLTCTADLHK